MRVSNTLELVTEVVQDLRYAGFDVAVFGGWAEELLQLSEPRRHRDIDLMVFDPDLDRLDGYLASKSEIGSKRQSHKRAFTVDGVMVELFLVENGATRFWDRLSYFWPDDAPVDLRGLRVAPATYLDAYRRDYARIREAGWVR